MKVKLYRCEEPGCDAAYLDPLQLRGHQNAHTEEGQVVGE